MTEVYASIPIPKFYVVFIFEEVPKDSCFVGGEPHNKFVRFKIDQIARTLPGPVIREWWTRTLDEVIAPFVKDRGYDWEISIDETPFDLWSLQGELPPPFESVAEKRWVKENKASPYYLSGKASCQSHARSRNSGPLGFGLTGRERLRRVVPKRDDGQHGNVISFGTNSYFTTTGTRIRSLPMTPDKVSTTGREHEGAAVHHWC